ncbi:hypothetical protein SteCoe_23386 [Stentor coeruleus]|uniref:Cilia- and flagella-associated protein 251 n=1 Tax=Stentor coeruleus TaxID=5963 RepID=A0A1R2BK09_9CILI|nr:hypothetical protein SteCoe_23386 [Stentor coeruleus]
MEADNALFNEESSDGIDAMNLKWVIGFNKDINNGVHNLTSDERTEIFYTSAHTGVIYNYETREQKLLQGHCNKISCCAVSSDKRFIVTADLGDDALMVVWDSMTATPLKTIFNPHGKGVYRMDISQNGNYICTLSDTVPQEITIWDWSKDINDDDDAIVVSGEVPNPDQKHYSIRFRTFTEYERSEMDIDSSKLEIATNSSKAVLFWKWNEQERTLNYDDNEKELKSFLRYAIDAFTQTVFIPGTTQAVTGTKKGQIIVWDMSFIMEADSSPEQRKPMKLVALVNHEATFLTTQGPYLVVGSSEGAVRFYDQRFTVEAWFENIKADNIMSISFADQAPRPSNENQLKNEPSRIDDDKKKIFACPDFIISSDNANIIKLMSVHFEDIPPVDKKEQCFQGQTLVKGMRYPVNAIAVHPKKPLIAIAGGKQDDYSYIHVWNYRTRIRKKFPPFSGTKILQVHNAMPLCMEFSPNGEFLCIGFNNGNLLLLDSENINREKQPQIKYTEIAKGITRIVFSNDGKAMVTTDKGDRVALFKWEHKRNNPDLNMEWVYCGQHKSHYKRITGVAFGESIDEREKSVLRLFSVGEDRKLIEYDTNSTDMTQLQILSNNKIEQEHKPTCCIWYPVSTGEDLLLTMNNAYKIKLWNANNKGCRLTCLGPTSGGPIVKIKLIAKYTDARTAIDAPDYYLVYATEEKVIGLIKLPVDGNPNKHVGLIGHPGSITDIAVSGDHKFLFTAGGDDLCVNMWFIDHQAIERQIALGGQGEEPFENMIEGGKFGKPYKDMKDFFYYSQIRSKKENTTKARKLEGSVPLGEIGFLMRAMGYYPSQQEIDNMINEVKYSKFTDTGKVVNHLDMDTLLRVFVNHRPVYGVDRNEIRESFKVLSKDIGSLPKEKIIDLLLSKGEVMQDSELKSCLISLLGPSEDIYETLPNDVSADFFLEKILGFEEVPEDQIEGDNEIVEEEEPEN